MIIPYLLRTAGHSSLQFVFRHYVYLWQQFHTLIRIGFFLITQCRAGPAACGGSSCGRSRGRRQGLCKSGQRVSSAHTKPAAQKPIRSTLPSAQHLCRPGCIWQAPVQKEQSLSNSYALLRLCSFLVHLGSQQADVGCDLLTGIK